MLSQMTGLLNALQALTGNDKGRDDIAVGAAFEAVFRSLGEEGEANHSEAGEDAGQGDGVPVASAEPVPEEQPRQSGLAVDDPGSMPEGDEIDAGGVPDEPAARAFHDASQATHHVGAGEPAIPQEVERAAGVPRAILSSTGNAAIPAMSESQGKGLPGVSGERLSPAPAPAPATEGSSGPSRSVTQSPPSALDPVTFSRQVETPPQRSNLAALSGPSELPASQVDASSVRSETQDRLPARRSDRATPSRAASSFAAAPLPDARNVLHGADLVVTRDAQAGGDGTAASVPKREVQPISDRAPVSESAMSVRVVTARKPSASEAPEKSMPLVSSQGVRRSGLAERKEPPLMTGRSAETAVRGQSRQQDPDMSPLRPHRAEPSGGVARIPAREPGAVGMSAPPEKGYGAMVVSQGSRATPTGMPARLPPDDDGFSRPDNRQLPPLQGPDLAKGRERVAPLSRGSTAAVPDARPEARSMKVDATQVKSEGFGRPAPHPPADPGSRPPKRPLAVPELSPTKGKSRAEPAGFSDILKPVQPVVKAEAGIAETGQAVVARPSRAVARNNKLPAPVGGSDEADSQLNGTDVLAAEKPPRRAPRGAVQTVEHRLPVQSAATQTVIPEDMQSEIPVAKRSMTVEVLPTDNQETPAPPAGRPPKPEVPLTSRSVTFASAHRQEAPDVKRPSESYAPEGRGRARAPRDIAVAVQVDKPRTVAPARSDTRKPTATGEQVRPRDVDASPIPAPVTPPRGLQRGAATSDAVPGLPMPEPRVDAPRSAPGSVAGVSVAEAPNRLPPAKPEIVPRAIPPEEVYVKTMDARTDTATSGSKAETVLPAALSEPGLPATPRPKQARAAVSYGSAAQSVTGRASATNLSGVETSEAAASVLSPVLDDAAPLRDDSPFGAQISDGRQAPATGAVPVMNTGSRNEAAMAVVRQIAEALGGSGSGTGDMIELKLNPEELGHLRFRMGQGEHGLVLTISAERTETLDLLRRNVDQLARHLSDMGYESASFSFGQGQSGGRGSSPAGAPVEVSEGQAMPEHIAAPPPQRMTAASGLDIRL
ncbi:flagellar hook-length control protein FliK [Salipiger abyssi]|uniref:flagellar hook-length control protein FliK n=1 Tax=Salipiger abyssi TaxID=1250539 RepID=UPI001A8FB12E|nr:flagellar hook-length control protein FliK [Salipiger abyssi]MBN9886134.1 flagellar hook-length control protein FliK [Salipiger abyssi]